MSATGRRGAPLLVLEADNLPQLIQGQEETVQVRVRNLLEALACDVLLTWQGHVQRPGEMSLGSIGPGPGRPVSIPVMPSESGSATLRVAAYYKDSRGHPQPPAYLEVRLAGGATAPGAPALLRPLRGRRRCDHYAGRQWCRTQHPGAERR